MNKNQCDGCLRNLPIRDGLHFGETVEDVSYCTKERYDPKEGVKKINDLLESGQLKISSPLVEEAKEGGYRDLGEKIINETMVCDCRFWQALEKSCGWAEIIEWTEEDDAMDRIEKSEKGWLYYAKRFHEINLTQSWQKAVEYLEASVTSHSK